MNDARQTALGASVLSNHVVRQPAAARFSGAADLRRARGCRYGRRSDKHWSRFVAEQPARAVFGCRSSRLLRSIATVTGKSPFPSGDELVNAWIERSLLGQAAQIGRVFKIAEEVSGLSACFRRAYADPIKRTSTLEPVGYGKRRPC
jgi:hypothetical protein